MNHPPARVGPLFVGPANAVLVIGQPWRWTRDTARRLGVRVLRVGGKALIPASELLPALEREAADRQAPAARELTDDEERAELRASIGMQRR